MPLESAGTHHGKGGRREVCGEERGLVMGPSSSSHRKEDCVWGSGVTSGHDYIR